MCIRDSLSAKEITNKRTEFEMGEMVTVECEEIKKPKPWTGEVIIEKIPKEKEEIVSIKYNNIYAEISGYSKVYRKYTETEKKTIIEKDSGVATIQAGQDLKIQVDSLTNYVSRILANQNLAITSNEVNNIAIDHKMCIRDRNGSVVKYF